MGVVPACMPVHHIYSWCPVKPVEGIRLREAGVVYARELLGGCQELNPDSLQKQEVLLTTDPSGCLSPPPTLIKHLLYAGLCC